MEPWKQDTAYLYEFQTGTTYNIVYTAVRGSNGQVPSFLAQFRPSSR